MQKQVGVTAPQGHGSSRHRTSRQLGSVPAARLCACPCFPQSTTPSQHADSLPSLSHTQASFMTSELLQKALTSSLVASLMAQMVTNLLAMQETRSKFWVGKIPWRREWQPTPVFLPGETRGQRSLAGYSPWGCKESDMTERLTHTHTNV